MANCASADLTFHGDTLLAVYQYPRDATCRQASSPRQMLAACDRVLDANPNNADARRRRAAYRGSAVAAVGCFAAGWPGLTPLADW